MTDSIKPWSTQRQVLWAVGVFGVIFWSLALFWILFVGGFGPGKEVPRAGLADVPWLLLPIFPLIYYIVVAHRVWTRKLWQIGVVIHAIMLILFIVEVVASGGRALVLFPFLIVGPMTWILHAKRNALTETKPH